MRDSEARRHYTAGGRGREREKTEGLATQTTVSWEKPGEGTTEKQGGKKSSHREVARESGIV